MVCVIFRSMMKCRRVREVLAERYPADKAIGFSEGEIRGWFWVEMPKPAR